MNEIVTFEPQAGALVVPVDQIRTRIAAIKQLIDGAMQVDVHYGAVTDKGKASLWKPGAELICTMFGIVVTYQVEALSHGDVVHYRVKCVGTSRGGEVLGEGLGEASTGEEKYRWRRAVCDEEWEETDPARRRMKYGHAKGGGFYKSKQVMTESPDSANTILKMATKRAHVAMTLTVAGCSDFFSQDLEDLPQDQPDDAAPDRKTPQAKDSKAKAKPAANDDKPVGEGERKWIAGKLEILKCSYEDVAKSAGVSAPLDQLSVDGFTAIQEKIRELLRAMEGKT